MKLQEIFDQLSTAEFSQISLGGQPAGEINENNWKTILNHINLGLNALYSRFTLKEGRVVLQLVPSQTIYNITSNFSQNSRKGRAALKYLVDTPDAPFNDDILKIVEVFTDAAVPLDLNNKANALSVLTPSANSVRVPLGMVTGDRTLPEEMWTDTLTLVYRAAHGQVAQGIGYFDPAKVEIELPYTHLEALLWFVASRAHNPIGMGTEFNAGNTYYAKYENACARLEQTGMQVDQGAQNYRLQRNGWV